MSAAETDINVDCPECGDGESVTYELAGETLRMRCGARFCGWHASVGASILRDAAQRGASGVIDWDDVLREAQREYGAEHAPGEADFQYPDSHEYEHTTEHLGMIGGESSVLYPRFPDLHVNYCHDCVAYDLHAKWD
jgi:hypothetical protein